VTPLDQAFTHEAAGGGWDVAVVRYATRTTRKSEVYLDYDRYGEPDAELGMDYFFHVLRGPDGVVLVDLGYDPAVGARRGRTTLCDPLVALERLGVAPAAVEDIVLTHLHYDHIGTLAAFPAARLWVQRAELDFWLGPRGREHPHCEVVEAGELELVRAALAEGRVRALDGSGPMLPGLFGVLAPGHSPGQTALVAGTHGGPVVLASDVAHYYEEAELRRPFAILTDLDEMLQSYDTLARLAAHPGARVLVGHDPLVMERFPRLPGEHAELGVVLR
jgi:glyoxylase-like metal-dependent hydrolase (beta-lactamase superfamily II)